MIGEIIMIVEPKDLSKYLSKYLLIACLHSLLNFMAFKMI